MQALQLGYEPVLQLKRRKTFVDVEKDVTLIQAKIRDGAVCQIRGQPRAALFSRAAQRSLPEELVIKAVKDQQHTK